MHHGPNGHHQCFVFELLGHSVESIAYDYRENVDGGENQLEPDVIFKIITQILQAIASIHVLGYVHGG